MHHMREMIATHPSVQGNTNDVLIRCIEECYSCAQTCISCADACLAEEMVEQLRQCIRLNLDCTRASPEPIRGILSARFEHTTLAFRSSPRVAQIRSSAVAAVVLSTTDVRPRATKKRSRS